MMTPPCDPTPFPQAKRLAGVDSLLALSSPSPTRRQAAASCAVRVLGMEILYNAIVVLHFIGLASLIGGFLVQIKSTERVVNNAMWHGAIVQLVTGLLLVGLAYPLNADDPDWEMNNAKIAVKTVILLAILVLAAINRKKPSITAGVWGAIGGLAILNVIIAVFW